MCATLKRTYQEETLLAPWVAPTVMGEGAGVASLLVAWVHQLAWSLHPRPLAACGLIGFQA